MERMTDAVNGVMAKRLIEKQNIGAEQTDLEEICMLSEKVFDHSVRDGLQNASTKCKMSI